MDKNIQIKDLTSNRIYIDIESKKQETLSEIVDDELIRMECKTCSKNKDIEDSQCVHCGSYETIMTIV
jgi:hypothetical protein